MFLTETCFRWRKHCRWRKRGSETRPMTLTHNQNECFIFHVLPMAFALCQHFLKWMWDECLPFWWNPKQTNKKKTQPSSKTPMSRLAFKRLLLEQSKMRFVCLFHSLSLNLPNLRLLSIPLLFQKKQKNLNEFKWINIWNKSFFPVTITPGRSPI